jgi:RimJ/RimL family protein N-acetyltransferase
MLISSVAKVVNFQRENGSRQLLRICLTTLRNTLFFYKKEVLGCLSVLTPFFCDSPRISLVVRPAEIADIPALKILTADYKKRDFFQWINDKYILFIAQIKRPPVIGETPRMPIVGYVCVCPAHKSKHKLVSLLKLKNTDYWAVDAFISPAFRGKGINSAIATEFLAQAKRDGYTRGYGTILFNNNASRRSYAFIGEKEIGLFTSITILGLTFHLLKRNKGYEEYFN